MLKEYEHIISLSRATRFDQEIYDKLEALFINKYFKGSQDLYNHFTRLYFESINREELSFKDTKDFYIIFETFDHDYKGVKFVCD